MTRNERKRKIIGIPEGFLILFLSLFPIVSSFAGEVVVIVNKANKTSSLSLKQLQQIYLGNKRNWNDNESIVLFLPLAKSNAMKSLANNALQMDGAEALYKYYLKAVFQEKLPEIPKSIANAVDLVASTPGGIAIIDIDETGKTDSVKIIKIGGL